MISVGSLSIVTDIGEWQLGKGKEKCGDGTSESLCVVEWARALFMAFSDPEHAMKEEDRIG